MKTPTAQELLGVQTHIDAELFKKEYSEWCNLDQTDPRKAPIIAELKKGGWAEIVGALIFCILVWLCAYWIAL